VKGIMNMDVLTAASEKYLQLKDTDSMVQLERLPTY
jgi:hypothetical protein